MILGSPRLWVNEVLAADSGKTPPLLWYSRALVNFPLESTGKKMLDSSRRQAPLVASALFGLEDSSSPQLEELRKTTQDLCIRAHNLWVIWVSDELSAILSHSLRNDDCLSATTPLKVSDGQ